MVKRVKALWTLTQEIRFPWIFVHYFLVPLNWNANFYIRVVQNHVCKIALWNSEWELEHKSGKDSVTFSSIFASHSVFSSFSPAFLFLFSLFFIYFWHCRGVRKGIVMVLKLDKISVSAIDLVDYSVDI